MFNIRTGQVIPPDYSSVRVYPGFFGTYQYGRDGNKDAYILLNKQGRPFAQYDRAEWFENASLLAARKDRDGKYALLDKNGKPLTPFRYESVSKAEGPFVWCWTDDEKKLIDGKGKRYGGKILADGKAREYRIGGR